MLSSPIFGAITPWNPSASDYEESLRKYDPIQSQVVFGQFILRVKCGNVDKLNLVNGGPCTRFCDLSTLPHVSLGGNLLAPGSSCIWVLGSKMISFPNLLNSRTHIYYVRWWQLNCVFHMLEHIFWVLISIVVANETKVRVIKWGLRYGKLEWC